MLNRLQAYVVAYPVTTHVSGFEGELKQLGKHIGMMRSPRRKFSLTGGRRAPVHIAVPSAPRNQSRGSSAPWDGSNILDNPRAKPADQSAIMN